MRRKIVKHGPSSLTISLPIKWVKKNNLTNGEELEVTEKGPELLISGKGKRELKEATLHIDTKNRPFLRRLFNMPYLRGFDMVTIFFDSYEILESIQNNIDALMGFEMIKQSANHCVLKNVAESKPEEFNSMLLRMFNICSTLFNELEAYIKENDEDALKRILLMQKTMTRIDLFCRRMINMGECGQEIRHSGSAYAIVRILEEIGDIGRDIAKKSPKIKTKNKKPFVELITKLIKTFALLKKIRYKGDVEAIYEYKDIKTVLRKMLETKRDFNSEELFMFLSLRQLVYKQHDLSEEVILWIPTKNLIDKNIKFNEKSIHKD